MNDRVGHLGHNKNRRGFILRLLAPIFWAAVILWLSLTSSPPQIPGPLGWDKLLHAGAYGLLAVLVAQYLTFQLYSSTRAFWPAIITTIAYGALVEVLQWAGQAGRTAEWWDLVADALGALVGCVVFRQACRLRCQHNGDRDEEHG